jgi:LPS sulfotransferase NodH
MQSPPAAWSVPWRTCIVASQARSGSNFLGDLMEQTGRLGRPGEFFSPFVLEQQHPDRDHAPAASCQLALEEGMSENGVLAIKLFPGHFLRLQHGVRLSEWFGDIRWVWLRRRDRVGQAISLLIAQQTGSFIHKQAAKREPSYDRRHLLALLTRIVQQDAMWEAFFARNRIDPLSLWFEDVREDPAGSVAAIGRQLEVELSGATVVPGQRVRSQTTELNERWRERFFAEAASIDRFDFPDPRTRGVLRRAGMRVLSAIDGLTGSRRGIGKD